MTRIGAKWRGLSAPLVKTLNVLLQFDLTPLAAVG
jgi:hypothetical protein